MSSAAPRSRVAQTNIGTIIVHCILACPYDDHTALRSWSIPKGWTSEQEDDMDYRIECPSLRAGLEVCMPFSFDVVLIF